MKKAALKQYARLIAVTGAGIHRGQEVVIRAQLDQPEFVELLAAECYRAGATKVTVEWEHQPLTKLDVRWQKPAVLGRVEKWEEARLRRRVETLPAFIYLESQDPDGLRGIDQQKWAGGIQDRMRVIKPIRDEMENKYQWCIAAVPGVRWAKKVFPELPKARAMARLWEAILSTSRADGPDPVAAWQAHNADLRSRCGYLNSLGLAELHYRAGNGTDFRVGLIPEGLFLGGSETALGSGIVYNPNIPSEEVFTSPMKGRAEGIVFGSRPLAYRGQLIENFSVRFENGRAVEVRAEKNEEALRGILTMDEGSAMLGECALVPYDSPIRNSGILFYNTLFDENAACHLALGRGFENCLRDYERLSLAECREKGVNDSIVHEDFMIGTADLAIDGLTQNGTPVPIFRDGNWAF